MTHHLHAWNHIRETLDSSNTPPVLVVAGLLPTMVEHVFSLNFLQAIYFLLLIPPAAYHCYSWMKKAVLPMIRRIKLIRFKKRD